MKDSQHNAAVAVLYGFRVTFEDVEELLDDRLVDRVIVANDNISSNVTTNDDIWLA